MDYEDENLKIKILPNKRKNKLLANANVSIKTERFGFITIKGFQIWPSPRFNERLQQAINITTPSKASYGRYVRQVFIEDPAKWFELEELIYSSYLRYKSQNAAGETETVDLEKIPF